MGSEIDSAGQIEAVAGRTWIVAAIEMTHRDKAKLSQCGLASQMAVIVATPSISTKPKTHRSQTTWR